MAKTGNQRLWVQPMPDNPNKNLSSKEGEFRVVTQKKIGTRWVTDKVIEEHLTYDEAMKKAGLR